jgi:hypothetical protein
MLCLMLPRAQATSYSFTGTYGSYSVAISFNTSLTGTLLAGLSLADITSTVSGFTETNTIPNSVTAAQSVVISTDSKGNITAFTITDTSGRVVTNTSDTGPAVPAKKTVTPAATDLAGNPLMASNVQNGNDLFAYYGYGIGYCVYDLTTGDFSTHGNTDQNCPPAVVTTTPATPSVSADGSGTWTSNPPNPGVPPLPPTISKAFGAGTFAQGGATTLSFTLTNPTQNVAALSGVGFTDNLPAGLVVATPNGLAGSCSGTITAVAGSTSVSLTGSTLAASGSCSFAVNVTAVATGAQNNKTGAVTSAEGGDGGTASASVTVVPAVRITSLKATPSVLWPPNQKMTPVTLSVTTSGGTGTTSCTITGVSSSEPVDPDGDWQYTGNPGDLTLSLRAARLATRVGTGNGRVYTITVQCGDGISSDAKTTSVLVPHDQGH